VVATDLQTKFLEPIEASNLEVRKHDITKDDLEKETFDLVSARKVLEKWVQLALAQMPLAKPTWPAR